MKNSRTFWKSRSGASAVEYALVLALVGAVLIAAVLYLSGTIGGSMEQRAECIGDSNLC